MGYTQLELSKMTGIPVSTLSGYFAERSTINAANVQKLADALNVAKSAIDPRFAPKEISNNNIVPILARSETEREELISLQRNYKDLGEDQREKLQSYLEFLRSQKPSMPEDDDID